MDDSNYDQSGGLFGFSKKKKLNKLLKKLISERLDQGLREGDETTYSDIIAAVKKDVENLKDIKDLDEFSGKIQNEDKNEKFKDFKQLFKETNGLKSFKREKQGFFSTSTKKLEENKSFGEPGGVDFDTVIVKLTKYSKKIIANNFNDYYTKYLKGKEGDVLEIITDQSDRGFKGKFEHIFKLLEESKEDYKTLDYDKLIEIKGESPHVSSPENYDSTGIKPIKNFKTYRNFLKDKKGIDKSEIESLSGGFGREGLTYGRIKGIIENLHKFLELVKFLEDNVSNENKEEEIKKLQWVIIQAEELNSLSFKAKLKEGIKGKKIDAEKQIDKRCDRYESFETFDSYKEYCNQENNYGERATYEEFKKLDKRLLDKINFMLDIYLNVEVISSFYENFTKNFDGELIKEYTDADNKFTEAIDKNSVSKGIFSKNTTQLIRAALRSIKEYHDYICDDIVVEYINKKKEAEKEAEGGAGAEAAPGAEGGTALEQAEAAGDADVEEEEEVQGPAPHEQLMEAIAQQERTLRLKANLHFDEAKDEAKKALNVQREAEQADGAVEEAETAAVKTLESNKKLFNIAVDNITKFFNEMDNNLRINLFDGHFKKEAKIIIKLLIELRNYIIITGPDERPLDFYKEYDIDKDQDPDPEKEKLLNEISEEENGNIIPILKGNKVDKAFNVFDKCTTNENWYGNELCKSLLLKQGSRGVKRTFAKIGKRAVDFFSPEKGKRSKLYIKLVVSPSRKVIVPILTLIPFSIAKVVYLLKSVFHFLHAASKWLGCSYEDGCSDVEKEEIDKLTRRMKHNFKDIGQIRGDITAIKKGVQWSRQRARKFKDDNL